MIIIGEKINASLPDIKAIMRERDGNELRELAKRQAAAKADYIDVNVSTGVGSHKDEILSMEWAISIIQEEVETPLSIDSADPSVLEAGLRARNGRPSLINSTKAEEQGLEQVISLASRYNAPVVALAMDETGIPQTVVDRLHACDKIAVACQKHRMSLETVFFDPLVMPISTDVKQGLVALNTVAEIKKRFPLAKTVMGLSNVSYGLPARSKLNAAFLHMAIYAGLDAAILDPLNEELMAAIRIAEVLVGKDHHCRRYIRTFRKCT